MGDTLEIVKGSCEYSKNPVFYFMVKNERERKAEMISFNCIHYHPEGKVECHSPKKESIDFHCIEKSRFKKFQEYK